MRKGILFFSWAVPYVRIPRDKGPGTGRLVGTRNKPVIREGEGGNGKMLAEPQTGNY